MAEEAENFVKVRYDGTNYLTEQNDLPELWQHLGINFSDIAVITRM